MECVVEQFQLARPRIIQEPAHIVLVQDSSRTGLKPPGKRQSALKKLLGIYRMADQLSASLDSSAQSKLIREEFHCFLAIAISFGVNYARIESVKLLLQLLSETAKLLKSRPASDDHGADHINQLAGVERHEKIAAQAVRKQKAGVFLGDPHLQQRLIIVKEPFHSHCIFRHVPQTLRKHITRF